LLNDNIQKRDVGGDLEQRLWNGARNIAEAGAHSPGKNAGLTDRFWHRLKAFVEMSGSAPTSGS
jgi:hypothetical protein